VSARRLSALLRGVARCCLHLAVSFATADACLTWERWR
jgi:hypothetical protein